jgi:hypothetical protein
MEASHARPFPMCEKCRIDWDSQLEAKPIKRVKIESEAEKIEKKQKKAKRLKEKKESQKKQTTIEDHPLFEEIMEPDDPFYDDPYWELRKKSQHVEMLEMTAEKTKGAPRRK